MNKAIILALAGALGSISTAYAADYDKAGFNAAKKQAASEYKVAKDKCDSLKSNAKDVCVEEAKVVRAKAEHDATVQYKADAKDVRKAREKVADAQYELATEKCDDLSGNAKSACKQEAKAGKAAAIADARRADTTPTLAERTAGAMDTTRDKTVAATATTAAATDNMRERTATAAGNMSERTANATDNMRDRTAAAADTTRDRAAVAADKTGDAISDTVITTKVKADLAADPGVKALDVHVETQKGVVMLSGFVPSKAEADKAVQLARGVKGVHEVKSSIQVKK